MDTPVCDRKRLYDTLFEAERAAAIMEKEHHVRFISYQCGNHYHIAHWDRELRNQHNTNRNRTYCDICQQEMRQGRYPGHIKKLRHIRKARGQEDVDTGS